jgi:hypothetical protein
VARLGTRARLITEVASASDLAARAIGRSRALLNLAPATDSTSADVTAVGDLRAVTVTVGIEDRELVGGGFDAQHAMGISDAPATVTIRGRGVHIAVQPRKVEA